MPMSGYLKTLREKLGHDLLQLPSAAVAVLDEKKRLLCGLHSDKNIWVIPGGLIEPGEHPADAAVRETWEETGFIVEPTALLGVFGGPLKVIHYPNGDIASYTGIVFRARVVGGTMRPDQSEILQVDYFSRQELAKLSYAKWMDAAFDAIFSESAVPQFQRATWRPVD